MPSASANISAKFIAQIETSPSCEATQSEPAAATRPTIVSISGRPAATSAPNATREDRERDRPGVELGLHHRVAVRGVEVRPHRRGAGQVDVTPSPPAAVSFALERVRGLNHRGRVGSCAGANDRRVAVLGDRETAGRRLDRGDALVRAQDRGRLERPQPLNAGLPTSLSASGGRPSGRSSTARRSSPARDRARRRTASRWPASLLPRAPSPHAARRRRGRSTTTSHEIATARRCVAVQRPSRPSGPTFATAWRTSGGGGAAAAAVTALTRRILRRAARQGLTHPARA